MILTFWTYMDGDTYSCAYDALFMVLYEICPLTQRFGQTIQRN